jgi:hypothetical protein
VRLYCEEDNPRRALGTVFESPFGAVYEPTIHVGATDRLGDPSRYIRGRVFLVLEPPLPAPWLFPPRVQCRSHGEAVVSLELLIREAAKVLRTGGPVRHLAVRCEKR